MSSTLVASAPLLTLRTAHDDYVQGSAVSGELLIECSEDVREKLAGVQIVALCALNFSYLVPTANGESESRSVSKHVYRAVACARDLRSEDCLRAGYYAVPFAYYLPFQAPATSFFQEDLIPVNLSVRHELSARLVGASTANFSDATVWGEDEEPPTVIAETEEPMAIRVLEKSGLQAQLTEHSWYCSYEIPHLLLGRGGPLVVSVKKDYNPYKAGMLLEVNVALQNASKYTVTALEMQLCRRLRFWDDKRENILREDVTPLDTQTLKCLLKGAANPEITPYLMSLKVPAGLSATTHAENAHCEWVLRIRCQLKPRLWAKRRWTSRDVTVPLLVWPDAVSAALIEQEVEHARKRLARDNTALAGADTAVTPRPPLDREPTGGISPRMPLQAKQTILPRLRAQLTEWKPCLFSVTAHSKDEIPPLAELIRLHGSQRAALNEDRGPTTERGTERTHD